VTELVQSVEIQSGGPVTSTGGILNGVAAGNFLSVQVGIFNSATNVDPGAADDKGNTWNTTTASAELGNMVEYISYAMNVAAGNTTVTIDQNADSFWATGSFAEYSGVLTAAALDQQTSNTGTSTTPTTGTTGATVQADELVLVGMLSDATGNPIGIDVPPTIGYSNLMVEQDGNSFYAGATDYKVVSAAEAQSANYGTITSSNWVAKIATFKATATSAPPDVAIPTQRSRLNDAPYRLGVHSSGFPSGLNSTAWF